MIPTTQERTTTTAEILTAVVCSILEPETRAITEINSPPDISITLVCTTRVNMIPNKLQRNFPGRIRGIKDVSFEI